MRTRSIFQKLVAVLSFALVLQFMAPAAANAADPITISGTVLSSDESATPVTGWINIGGWGSEIADDGTYSIDTHGLVAAGDQNVWISPNQYGARYFYKNINTTLVAGANTKNFTLDPYPVGTESLTGTLEKPNGDPIENVSIQLSAGQGNAWRYYSTSSQADGTFSVDALPAGTYNVQIWSQDIYDRSLQVTLPVVSNPTWVLIPRATNFLVGKVVSEVVPETGQPDFFPDAQINGCVTISSQRVCDWSRADENGDYSLALPAGGTDATLTAYPGGEKKFFYSTATVAVDGAGQTFDFPVKPYPTGDLTISGTVVDENDVAIPNIGISIYSNTGMGVSYNANSTDGTFSFPKLLKGSYSIYAYSSDHNTLKSNKLISLSTTSVSNAKIVLHTKGEQEISGHVYDNSGQPIENALVQISLQGAYQQSENAYTNQDGAYSFSRLTLGAKYEVVALSGGGQNYLNSDKQILTAPNVSVDLTMKPYRTGTSRVSGKLLGPDGLALAGQNISLNIYGDESSGLQAQDYSRSTDADGNYSFENLPSGEGNISSWLQGTTGCGSNIYLSGSNSKTFDCQHVETGAKLTLNFRSSTGQPVSGFTNMEWRNGDSKGSSIWVDGTALGADDSNIPAKLKARSSVLFENLPKSETSNFSHSQEFSSSTEYLKFSRYDQSFVMDTLNGDQTKTFVIESAGAGDNSVSGRVLNADGLPLEGVELAWYSSIEDGVSNTGYMSGTVVTNSDGAYSVSGLKAGSTFSLDFSPWDQTLERYKEDAGAISNSIYGTVVSASSARVRNMVIKYDQAAAASASNPNETGTYSVRVADANGTPIAGIKAYLSGPIWQEATSGDDGFLNFMDLPVGNYNLWTDSGVGYVSSYSDDVNFVIASEALDVKDSTDIVLQAAPVGSSSVSGSLVNQTSQQNEADYECTVSLNQLDDLTIKNFWLERQCSVDSATGIWSVSDLPAGEYKVAFSPTGSSSGNGEPLDRQFQFPEPVIFHVNGIETKTIAPQTFSSSPNETGSKVVVSLLDSETRLPFAKSAYCNLNSSKISGVSNQEAFSDADSKVTFSNLVVGVTYDFSCWSKYIMSAAPLKLTAVAGEKTAKVYLTQRKFGAKVKGVIRDSEGNPIEGVTVSTLVIFQGDERAGDGMNIQDTTDSNGEYYLEDAPEGTSNFTIMDPNGVYARYSESRTLVSGSNPDFNKTLTVGAKIRGSIGDKDGKTLSAGVEVILEPQDAGASSFYAGTQSRKANFKFDEAVGAGNYRVIVRSWDSKYASGYLQNDGTVKLATANARTISVNPASSTSVEIPNIKVGPGASISGQVIFQASDGSPVTGSWTGGAVNLYFKDGTTTSWVKFKQTHSWVGNYNNGYYSVDGLPAGQYKLEFTGWAAGAFDPSFSVGKTTLASANTFVVTEGISVAGANGVLKYARPTSAATIDLESLSTAKIAALRDAVAVDQHGTTVRVKAPDDLVGQYVNALRSTRTVSTASVGRAAVASTWTGWLPVDADGYVTIPSSYIATENQTFFLVNATSKPVGIADVAGAAPALRAQLPGTSLPSKAKAYRKFTLKPKTNLGGALRVTVKGCTVKSNYKTTYSYVTKKVRGKNTRVRVSKKTLTSYTLSLGRRGSTCTVTQTSPATSTLAALRKVNRIKAI